MNELYISKDVYARLIANIPEEERGVQNVFTPTSILDKDKFIIKKIKKADVIHDIFNWEWLDHCFSNLYFKKKYYYYYDSIFDKGIAQAIVEFYQDSYDVVINIEYIDIRNACYLDRRINKQNKEYFVSIFKQEEFFKAMNDVKEKEKKEFKNRRHFDLVISNPSYNDGFDVNIINSIFENNMADEGIFVHPTTFLFSEKYKKYFKDLNKLSYVKMFWGNIIFNIGLFVPVCISYWKKKKKDGKIIINDEAIHHTEYQLDNVNDFKMHAIHHPYKLIEFINEYKKQHKGSIIDAPNNIDAKTYAGMNGYLIKVSPIQGSKPKEYFNDDFFILIHKDINDNINPKKGWKFDDCCSYGLTLWSFKTAKEREHFINYCKSKVVRFLLSLKKFNQNMVRGQQCEYIPWMDFTKDWNDKKLCKEFNIDSDLWNYIDKFIPDYYEDYKSGF